MINQGTIDASFAGGQFKIAVGNALVPGTFTNQGLIHVSNGDTVIFSNSTNFTNLSGTTLTGGTYEVDAGSTMQLADNTQIQTLNANVTLSGAGSVIQSLNTTTSSQVSFDSTLTTIGANGQLHLVSGRNFTTSNAITDNGLLDLGGTTFTAPSLAIGATGTLNGFGTVAASVTNSGLIDAHGGSLSLQGGLTNLSGTTLTGVVVAEVGGVGYWLTVNVGDSRTYRYSGGDLEQVTIDHSQVQEFIEAGFLTPEQARTDPRRNVITRALGAGMVLGGHEVGRRLG